MRKEKWPTPEEFWKFERPIEFRVESSLYAAKWKFKSWLEQQLKAADASPQSYDNMLREKYGMPNLYNDYDATNELNRNNIIFHYDYRYFLNEEELEKGDFSDLQPLRKSVCGCDSCS